jgi:hypothetical protein
LGWIGEHFLHWYSVLKPTAILYEKAYKGQKMQTQQNELRLEGEIFYELFTY